MDKVLNNQKIQDAFDKMFPRPVGVTKKEHLKKRLVEYARGIAIATETERVQKEARDNLTINLGDIE